MRVSLIVVIIVSLQQLILWLFFSKTYFFLMAIFSFFLCIVFFHYSDKLILYFLGARELKDREGMSYYSISDHEAFKLAVKNPQLFVYEGILNRSFILQSQKMSTIVISRILIESLSQEELSLLFFELLIQTKKKHAIKKTRSLFIVSLKFYLFHVGVSIISQLIPVKNIKGALLLTGNYFIYPWSQLFLKLTIGQKYGSDILNLMKNYPAEGRELSRIFPKLRGYFCDSGIVELKLTEMGLIKRSHTVQRIFAIEKIADDINFSTRKNLVLGA